MPPLGLTTSEATARRANGQGNNVKIKESRTYTEIVFANLFNFINSILFALGFGLLLLGKQGDALATSGLVLINVIVGVFQEARAKQMLDRIALLTRPKATVLRDGAEHELDPREIVLGDIVLLNAGDQIVVDGKIVYPENARVDADESLLTGESDLVVKVGGAPVYSGSFCVNGSAYYEVSKVGTESLANQLTAGARQFRSIKTPLQREIELVLRVLMLVVAQLGILFAIASLIYETSLVENLQIAAVIAGLVPNGLILMTTVAYAMGAVRMAGKGALVQQANAIESLSNVNVLCLDKTGTLTANKIYLKHILPITLSESAAQKILGEYAASLTNQNATSNALAQAYPQAPQTVKQEIAFSSARKWSGLEFAAGTYILGAPEILRRVTLLNSEQEKYIEDCAAQGLRVLLFGVAASPLATDALAEPTLPAQLTPVALLSFGDELRPEAHDTLRGFKEAGVQLKIISGDNPQTVAALAKQAGLSDDIKLVSGLELAEMDEESFKRAAQEATVFGRITPQQKQNLVKALREAGNYVAMIGDGVNDVLSLKQAQLGIAMQSGSQAARSVADIVLLNDSFAALLPAVREGQRIVNGMQAIIRLFLSRTSYVALLIIETGIVGAVFPFVPKHNTLAALLTVGLPTFWLAVWAKPGPRQRDHLVRSVIHFILPAAFTIALAALGTYLFYLMNIEDEQTAISTARTAMETVIIWCGLLLIIFVEPPIQKLAGGGESNGDWRPTILAGLSWVVFMIVLNVPGLREAFELAPLSLSDYSLIGGVVVLWALGVLLIWRRKLLYKFLNIEV